MEALTERQLEVLDFLNQFIMQWGYPPSHREIGSFLSIASTNGVRDHLTVLEKKGYIERDKNLSRGIRIL